MPHEFSPTRPTAQRRSPVRGDRTGRPGRAPVGLLTPAALAALQRSAGNRAVGTLPRPGPDLAVQRTVAFARGGRPVRAHEVPVEVIRDTLAGMAELRESIPAGWWLSKERNRLLLSRVGTAVDAVVAATRDYGTVDLDSPEDLARLCRAVVEVATATGTGGTTATTTGGAAPGHPGGARVAPPAGVSAPRLVPAPPAVGTGAGRRAPEPMRAVIVTPDTRQGIVDVLREWHRYASDQYALVTAERRVLERERTSLGNGYYEDAAVDFRRRYRQVRALYLHLSGAENESRQVRSGLLGAGDRDLARFGALYHGDRLEGVVEWSTAEATYISNIVGNPHNLVPAPGERPVGNVAAALLVLTVARNRQRAPSPSARRDVKLWALNNKVKGLYDRYHFRVFIGDAPVSRPERGWKREDEHGRLRPVKEVWHSSDNSSMVLTQAKADDLLKDVRPGEWLTVPEELGKYLEPGS